MPIHKKEKQPHPTTLARPHKKKKKEKEKRNAKTQTKMNNRKYRKAKHAAMQYVGVIHLVFIKYADNETL